MVNLWLQNFGGFWFLPPILISNHLYPFPLTCTLICRFKSCLCSYKTFGKLIYICIKCLCGWDRIFFWIKWNSFHIYWNIMTYNIVPVYGVLFFFLYSWLKFIGGIIVFDHEQTSIFSWCSQDSTGFGIRRPGIWFQTK